VFKLLILSKPINKRAYSRKGAAMTAIIFDLDDTLYDQLQPFQQAYQEQFNFPDVSIEKLYVLSRKYSDEVFHLTENGNLTIKKMHRYRIKKAFAYFGYEITDVQADKFQKSYLNNQQKIQLLPDMKDALDYCSANGVNLGMITNGPEEHQKKKITQLNLEKWIPRQQIFISSVVGFAKPDPRIFHLVEERLHLNKQETYYIGDSFQNDMVGAHAAGWKTIWSNHRQHKQPRDSSIPEFILTKENSLLELCKKII
jgi:putative hydrolase of the HAD superfamily